MELSATSWKFTRAELVALLKFASTDSTREHLFGIGVDLAGGRVCATNGHSIAWWQSPKTKLAPTRFCLNGKQMRMLASLRVPKEPRRKPRGRRIAPQVQTPELYEVTFESNQSTATYAGFSLVVPHTEAAPPPYEKVFVDYASGSPCSAPGVNLSYLADALAIADVAYARSSIVTIQPGPSELDPLRIRFEGDSEWNLMIMPARSGNSYSATARSTKPRKKVANG